MEQKVIVITGAGGILMSEIAENLLKDNHLLALIDINLSSLEVLSTKLNSSNVAIFQGDVLDEENIEKIKEKILNKFNRIDALINGAGGNSVSATTSNPFYCEEKAGDKSFFDLSLSAIDKTNNLNFLGTLIPSRVFGKYFADQNKGNIINISSLSAAIPLTKVPVYSAAKAGCENFTKWLAVYLAQNNVRVNAIAPGFFLTIQNQHLLLEEGKLSARGKKVIERTPLKRFGTPADLFGVINFLLDDRQSGFITGIVIEIDGGFSAYSGV